MACVLFWTHACYLADGSFHVIIKKVNIYEAMKTETKNRKGGWHMAALKKLPIELKILKKCGVKVSTMWIKPDC